MTAVLLTFLGTGKYQPCKYDFSTATESSGSPDEVTFFSVALANHLQPDRVVSLQTRGAAEKHGAALAGALEAGHFLHAVSPIPDGSSEAELWEIFSALTAQVPAECELHLDITHGFRSLPVLGFIALSFLRVTRKVTIGGIYYGAWEARNEQGLAPDFNLTPFLSLLDWTAAADQFLNTGSAVQLGHLLSMAQQSLWRNPRELPRNELPRKLNSLGQSLRESSLNLLLLRTGHRAAGASSVAQQLDAALPEANAFASPFLQLLQPVREQLTGFSGTDLATLWDLVAWLAERGQTAASLTLASEWLTSYVMVDCGREESFRPRYPQTWPPFLKQPSISRKNSSHSS